MKKTTHLVPHTKGYMLLAAFCLAALCSQALPDAPWHNEVGEIKGTTFPKGIIGLGSHLDSWDLARGAHDDAISVQNP